MTVAWPELRAQLHRFVARHVSASDAEDVVQEALLRIHRGLPGVRSDGALVGWMYQVTRHALVDHVRATRPSVPLDAALGAHDLEPGDQPFELLARCIAPFTMKSRVQRGRAELRQLLQACCAIEVDVRGHVVEVVPRGCSCPR